MVERATVERAADKPRDQSGESSERGLGPAFAWAAGGGAVVLALAALLYVLGVASGAWSGGTPYREFLGIFLASSLGIFIAREFDLRTG